MRYFGMIVANYGKKHAQKEKVLVSLSILTRKWQFGTAFSKFSIAEVVFFVQYIKIRKTTQNQPKDHTKLPVLMLSLSTKPFRG